MKRALQIILILVLIGGIIGYVVYNKPHENIEKSTADIKMSAIELFSDYETDETAANTKYLDKLIEVTGTIMSANQSEDGVVNVLLESGGMFGVKCSLDELTEHERTEFSVGETVTFKGKCTGSVGDVVLVRCVEVR